MSQKWTSAGTPNLVLLKARPAGSDDKDRVTGRTHDGAIGQALNVRDCDPARLRRSAGAGKERLLRTVHRGTRHTAGPIACPTLKRR